MNLRVRLALSVVAIATPTLLALPWLRLTARDRAQEEFFAEGVRALLSEPNRAFCEASPGAWSQHFSSPPPFGHGPGHHGDRGPGHHDDGDGPRPGPPRGEPPRRHGGHDPPGEPHGGAHRPVMPAMLYPYRADLSSATDAPPLDPGLLAEARAGAAAASVRGRKGELRVLDVLVRMPWGTGPCAYVLARHHDLPQSLPAGSLLREALLPVGVVVGVMLLVLGPLIRRVRRLAAQVRGSIRAGYALPVEIAGADELTELGHAFNAVIAEVRQQLDAQARRERTLRDFLENTTHDLMTPLTVLTGHLASLEESASGRAAPDPDALRAAMTEAHYVASLVHNLGAAARLDAGEPQIHRSLVSLGDIVERAVGRLRPIARLRQVSLDHAVPLDSPQVFGDMTLIEQAISNIVQNAVKHNNPGGHVAVVLDARERSFSLDVLDDGPGIPEADIARLLLPQQRGDEARTRDPHGQGLGLAIARRVALLHGWTMTLGPSEFGGLRVSFAGETSTPDADLR